MSIRGLITLIVLVLLAAAIGAISFLYFKKKKMAVGAILAALALCPLALAITLFTMFFYTNYPLRYETSIAPSKGKYVFALYHDDRIGEDASWHVFRLSQTIVAKKYRIPANYMDLTSEQSKQWHQKRALYILSKGEENVGEAYLYIVHDKYLVLVRNGMFQGLYDIEQERTIIDDQSRIFTGDVISERQASEFVDELFKILKYPELSEDEREELVAGIQRSHVNQFILNVLDKEKHDPNTGTAENTENN